MAGEVTLIGKARAHRNGRQRVAFPEKLLSAIDAHLCLVGVRWHPGLKTKHAMKMKRAQIRETAQKGKRDGLGKILIDVFTRSLDSTGLATAWNTRTILG